MRRIAHKTPLLSLTILVYLLAAALFFVIDPLPPSATKTSDALPHNTFPGSWTDLIGSWETRPAGSSQATVITFTAKNLVIIDTECATHQGGFLSIVPGHLAVFDLHIVETRCPSDSEQVEPLVQALEAATEYGIAGGQFLQVFGAASQAAFMFLRAPAPQPDEAAL